MSRPYHGPGPGHKPGPRAGAQRARSARAQTDPYCGVYLVNPPHQAGTEPIREMRREGDRRRTYGSLRVRAELRHECGLPVNVKRVARLMRQAGLQALR